jgi:hypothetical protein
MDGNAAADGVGERPLDLFLIAAEDRNLDAALRAGNGFEQRRDSIVGLYHESQRASPFRPHMRTFAHSGMDPASLLQLTRRLEKQ